MSGVVPQGSRDAGNATEPWSLRSLPIRGLLSPSLHFGIWLIVACSFRTRSCQDVAGASLQADHHRRPAPRRRCRRTVLYLRGVAGGERRNPAQRPGIALEAPRPAASLPSRSFGRWNADDRGRRPLRFARPARSQSRSPARGIAWASLERLRHCVASPASIQSGLARPAERRPPLRLVEPALRAIPRSGPSVFLRLLP